MRSHARRPRRAGNHPALRLLVPEIPARLLALATVATVLAACSAVPQAASPIDQTRGTSFIASRTERQLARHLDTAAASLSRIRSGKGDTRDVAAYNNACADLTVLLRSAEGGSLWNKPLAIPGGGTTYQLGYRQGAGQGLWNPDYFTAFRPTGKIAEDRVTKPNLRAGVGGTLVGVRKTTPREEFSPREGLAAAVTATLEFHGSSATLVLNNPVKRTSVELAGRRRPLAADFSAPLCFYPKVNQTLLGLMEGLDPGRYASTEGIYLLQPYDPARIPVFYVHGLISTPFIWRDPVNRIEEDPVLRKSYQAVVFGYPTGNPAAYSALKFREALVRFENRYPMPNGCVIVCHSLGGLISQMQTETLTRGDWHRTVGTVADDILAKEGPDSLITRAVIFEANPKAKRVVFIATPHKGADMAEQSIGQLAIRLIHLPATLAQTLTTALGNSVAEITGNAKTLPDSVSSLSPKNPLLHVLASEKVTPPCHSIIGNRGKPGPLAQSSDGVVPYWSSHLSYAESEVIVPGPHSCYDYPESIAEIKRILHLHLREGR